MILLDCDDVLSKTAEAVLDYLKATYDVSFTIDQMFDHNYEVSFGISEEWVKEAFEAIITGAVPLEPYPGAREFVNELRKIGKVAACTATASARWTGARAIWLEEMVGLSAKTEQIICAREHKKLIGGTLLIEDHWKNCAEFEATQRCATILFDRPWNQYYAAGNRVHSFEQCLEAAETLVRWGRS